MEKHIKKIHGPNILYYTALGILWLCTCSFLCQWCYCHHAWPTFFICSSRVKPNTVSPGTTSLLSSFCVHLAVCSINSHHSSKVTFVMKTPTKRQRCPEWIHKQKLTAIYKWETRNIEYMEMWMWMSRKRCNVKKGSI